MKRSNRIILIVGFFLAIVAFGGIIFFLNQRTDKVDIKPTTTKVVVAATDMKLGDTIKAEQVKLSEVALEAAFQDSFHDISQVVGRIVRANVKAEQQLRESTTFAAPGTVSQDISPLLDRGQRAIAIRVDQTSAVGTLVKAGDRIDLVVGITGPDKFPTLTVDAQTGALTPLAGVNTTSVKLILQNKKVLATLLPPPDQTQNQQGQTQGQPQQPTGTTLNGQEQIIILQVGPEDAEIIKFAQLDGTLTVLLRATADYVDLNGLPTEPVDDQVRGIILKRLVDEFGVLPPQIVESILPRTTR